MPPLLELSRLSVGHGPGEPVLSGLKVELEAGELVCVLGPNGVGKSTLLRTVAGLQKPLAGEVLLRGEELHALPPQVRARRVAVVLTEPIRVGLLTARELVGLGRYPHTSWTGAMQSEDRRQVDVALELVGAVDLAERQVGELSDGERQKVMIARAVAQESELLVLDEPTAFLDLGRRVEVMALLRRLGRQTGRGALMATHDLDLALAGSDRLWLLTPTGRLLTGGPEDLVLEGRMGEIFDDRSVRFDPAAGSFRLNTTARGAAVIVGQGLPALWARRALERHGFKACGQEEADPATLRIEAEEGAWRSQWQGQEREHRSLYALLRYLRETDGSG